MLTITKKQGLTKNKQLSKMVKNTKNKQRLCMNNMIYDELLVCKINFKKCFHRRPVLFFAGLRFFTAVPPELQITTFPAAAQCGKAFERLLLAPLFIWRCKSPLYCCTTLFVLEKLFLKARSRYGVVVQCVAQLLISQQRNLCFCGCRFGVFAAF